MAIDLLLKYDVKFVGKEIHEDVLLLSNRYNRIKRDYQNKLISIHETDLLLNQINFSAIEIIDKLPLGKFESHNFKRVLSISSLIIILIVFYISYSHNIFVKNEFRDPVEKENVSSNQLKNEDDAEVINFSLIHDKTEEKKVLSGKKKVKNKELKSTLIKARGKLIFEDKINKGKYFIKTNWKDKLIEINNTGHFEFNVKSTETNIRIDVYDEFGNEITYVNANCCENLIEIRV